MGVILTTYIHWNDPPSWVGLGHTSGWGGIASLVTVWDLQSVGPAQWKLLSVLAWLKNQGVIGEP